MALPRVVSEISNDEKYRDLEIPVKGQSRSRTVFEIFDFKNAVNLKTGLWVRQGH